MNNTTAAAAVAMNPFSPRLNRRHPEDLKHSGNGNDERWEQVPIALLEPFLDKRVWWHQQRQHTTGDCERIAISPKWVIENRFTYPDFWERVVCDGGSNVDNTPIPVVWLPGSERPTDILGGDPTLYRLMWASFIQMPMVPIIRYDDDATAAAFVMQQPQLDIPRARV